MLWDELVDYVNSKSPKLRFAKKANRILIYSKCFVPYGWRDDYPEGHYMSFIYFHRTGREVKITYVAPTVSIKRRTDLKECDSYLGLETEPTCYIETFKELKSYIEDFMKALANKEIEFLMETKLKRIEKDFS
jgi:hypothetical protein